MKGKKVLITGASRGIGKNIAKQFIDAGYEVYGTSRLPSKVEDKLEGLKMVALDVGDINSIKACYAEVGDVDILINNAGQSQLGSFEDISTEKLRFLFEVNFFGVVELTKQFLPAMRKNRSGYVVNIGSLIATFPLPYYSSYTSSKIALQGYTSSLRMELSSFGVNVSLVEPNDISTSIVPDFLSPEDSEYFPYASKIKENVVKNMSKAESADVIGKTVFKICQKKNPAPVYHAGGNANMLVFLKKILPARIVEKLTKNSYGL